MPHPRDRSKKLPASPASEKQTTAEPAPADPSPERHRPSRSSVPPPASASRRCPPAAAADTPPQAQSASWTAPVPHPVCRPTSAKTCCPPRHSSPIPAGSQAQSARKLPAYWRASLQRTRKGYPKPIKRSPARLNIFSQNPLPAPFYLKSRFLKETNPSK